MKRVVFELDDKEHKKFKEKAVKLNKTMKEIMTGLLKIWMKK